MTGNLLLLAVSLLCVRRHFLINSCRQHSHGFPWSSFVGVLKAIGNRPFFGDCLDLSTGVEVGLIALQQVMWNSGAIWRVTCSFWRFFCCAFLGTLQSIGDCDSEESRGMAGVTRLFSRFSLMFVCSHLSSNKQFGFSGDDLDLSTGVQVGRFSLDVRS